MGPKIIEKSIELNAPKEKVWDVLINDQYNREWFAAFSPGTSAQTDWQEGSKVIFADSGGGMIGTVVSNKPYELLSVQFTGLIVDGKEDYESDMAKAVNGGREIYRLSENAGVTRLAIESDMDEEHFDSMSKTWDNALEKIKELAETR